jgi:hypothetical protein
MPEPLNPAEYFNGERIPTELPNVEPLVTDADTEIPWAATVRKAFAGAISAAAIAIGTTVPGIIADGAVTVNELGVLGIAVSGALLLGFAAVWVIPNASRN